MGRLLFDTHALIWTVEDEPIHPEARRAIDLAAARNEAVFVSPITAWERGMLVAKGRIASRLPPKDWFARVISNPLIAVAEMTIDILTDASFLPEPVHGDPADRILIATARAHDLTLITHDAAILRYAKMGHLSALPC
jgi:PIN domain nuclease of toxin-antitoxin system